MRTLTTSVGAALWGCIVFGSSLAFAGEPAPPYPPLPSPALPAPAASTAEPVTGVPPNAPPAPVQTAAPLTAQELKAFAELVDDSEIHVEERIQSNPSLATLSLQAAEARRERKSSGKALTIVGFVILGVAQVVGTIVLATSYENGDGRLRVDWTRYAVGLGIDLGGLAVGLPIAIPGIVKLAKKSDTEKAAIDAYQASAPPPVPPPSAPEAPPPSHGTVMMVPIISLSF